jgi:hypothetical protein
MVSAASCAFDLMPPPFSDGLWDWSRTDGRPDGPTYGDAGNARLAQGDPDFGICLELRKVSTVERLRYMGELPIRAGAFIEVRARFRQQRGPLGLVRIAAWPGGAGGEGVAGLRTCGTAAHARALGRVGEIVAVIGPEPLPGVDMVWDDRVLYAHVGLDLLGPDNAVMRIENLSVRDVTTGITGRVRVMPGFGTADFPARAAD